MKETTQRSAPQDPLGDISAPAFDTISPELRLKIFGHLPRNAFGILKNEFEEQRLRNNHQIMFPHVDAYISMLPKVQDKVAGLTYLSYIIQRIRIQYKDILKHSNITTDLNPVMEIVKQNPDELSNFVLKYVSSETDTVFLVLQKPEKISIPENQNRLSSLADLPGEVVVPFAIGGGSDVLQAAVFLELYRRHGKQCPAVVSTRGLRSGSQGKDGNIDEERQIINPKRIISPDVYEVGPDTQVHQGRFYEPIPVADGIGVYLVIDRQKDELTGKFETVLDDIRKQTGLGVSTIIGHDTGGDSASPNRETNRAVATPDQDNRVLSAMQRIRGIDNKLSAIVAPGVDAPDNFQIFLDQATAKYYSPNPDEVNFIKEKYHGWHMDGSDPNLYGKTPFAWLASLAGKEGISCLDGIPLKVVLDDKNRWNPFVYIQKAMQGCFYMDLGTHLRLTNF